MTDPPTVRLGHALSSEEHDAPSLVRWGSRSRGGWLRVRPHLRHPVGPDHAGFIDFYAREILPALQG